jgi:hypothetical protein
MTYRIVALAAALLSACAGSSSRAGGSAAAPAPAARDTMGAAQGGPTATVSQQRRIRADRNTITREEIAETGQGSASLYDFVVARHNEWLRSGGGSRLVYQPGQAAAEDQGRSVSVTVYVDGVRFGANTESLRGIPLATVALARRLSASEAQNKYGLDNNAGTIEVWTSLERVR